jgi:hypothetical protein
MQIISGTMLWSVTGGSNPTPPSGGSTVNAGTASATCGPGFIPIAISGGVKGKVGPLDIETTGSIATCLPIAEVPKVPDQKSTR